MTLRPGPPPDPTGLDLPPAPPVISVEFQRFLDTSPDYLILASALVVITFGVVYVGFFDSGATRAGRALRFFIGGLILLFFSNIASLWLGLHYPYRWLVRDVVYITVLIGSLRLLIALLANWNVGARVDITPRNRHERKDRT